MEYEIEVPERIKTEILLEELLFDATEENIIKAKEIVKNSNFDNEFLWRLFIHAGKIRRFSYKILANFVDCLKHPKYLFEKTDFLVYLLKRNLIDSSYLTDTVLSFVEKQGVTRIENVYPTSSLLYAIINDDIDKIVFESAKPDFFITEQRFIDKKRTYIDIAAFCGSLNIFKYLLINGSKLTVKTGKNAVEGGCLEIVEICSQQQINLKNCLHDAIKYHRNDVAKWIVDEYSFTDRDLVKCVSAFNLHLFFSFYPSSMNIDAIGSNQRSLLMVATINGDIDMVKFLLEQKITIDAKDICSETALVFAVCYKHNDILSLLIENGADLEVTDADDFTPVFSAMIKMNYEAVKMIVNKGKVDINQVQNNFSLIALGAMKNDEITKFLYEKGANIENVSFGLRGEIPLLSYYINQKNIPMIEYFLERGATINEKLIEESKNDDVIYSLFQKYKH